MKLPPQKPAFLRALKSAAIRHLYFHKESFLVNLRHFAGNDMRQSFSLSASTLMGFSCARFIYPTSRPIFQVVLATLELHKTIPGACI
uniref:Uncharacterized protein n=1 Tax=Anguilla anguilla TaxID=7936 RepID=A0A0E9WBU8_ANGAN